MRHHNAILHEEAFARAPLVGETYYSLLTQRVSETAEAALGVPDPDVSVLIRTRNHGRRIEELFADLSQQVFDGSVHVVLVDTDSTDKTRQIARAHGATIVPIKQETFNYAHSLNVGFEAAENPYVLTLVGHSHLSNQFTLKGLTRWYQRENFGGAFGAALPDVNATPGDFLISLLQRTKKRLAPATLLSEWEGGTMVAHRSVVSRRAWKELGGYDEAYGNGGEDTDFGRRMLAAGMDVIREPVLSVLHSYGLNLRNTVRQIRKLRSLRSAAPAAFDQELVRYRQDIQARVEQSGADAKQESPAAA